MPSLKHNVLWFKLGASYEAQVSEKFKETFLHTEIIFYCIEMHIESKREILEAVEAQCVTAL